MTLDRLPDGSLAPGGPALYSARMAAALGARVTLVTTLPPAYPATAIEGLDLVALPAARACEYENRYAPNGARTQLLHHEGSSIPPSGLAGLPPTGALLVAPAFHELDAIPPVLGDIAYIALQGPLRQRRADGRVVPHPDPLAAAAPFLRPGAIAFLSEDDIPNADSFAAEAAHTAAAVFVTRAHRGVTVVTARGARSVPALPAAPTDPTGAGDCFAAAFAVRYGETRGCAEALRWALAAGALATESHGPAGVPTRADVEARARGSAP